MGIFDKRVKDIEFNVDEFVNNLPNIEHTLLLAVLNSNMREAHKAFIIYRLLDINIIDARKIISEFENKSV